MRPADLLGDFSAAIASGDAKAAERLIRAVADAGLDAAEICDGLIGPAQVRVGDLWEDGTITVAEEHRATRISRRMVDVVVDAAPPPGRVAGKLLVVNPPGEWHRLMADTIGLVLAACGAELCATQDLGSAAQLVPVVHDEGPETLVVSCSIPANLAAAARVVAVARETRLPVVVGGRAFGPNDRRSAALGVSRAGSIAELVEMLEANVMATPGDGDEAAARRFAALEPRISDLSALMAERLGDVESGGDPVADGLWLIRAFASSIVCDDPGILAEHLAWQQRRHVVADAVVPDLLAETLAGAVEEIAPELSPMVSSAVR